MKTAVIVFPGSNCDKDIGSVLEKQYKHSVDYIWHKNSLTKKFDLVVLPGGFSYGDYLRCGAMARFSIAMESVKSHISRGGYVLGICNGFQILTEAHLLPGALVRNKTLKHICKNVGLKPLKNPLMKGLVGNTISLPVSHGEGAYFADEKTLNELSEKNRILLKYSPENPNGSIQEIAGISSDDFKITGLMPHPERAIEDWNENTDGRLFFDSYFSNLPE